MNANPAAQSNSFSTSPASFAVAAGAATRDAARPEIDKTSDMPSEPPTPFAQLLQEAQPAASTAEVKPATSGDPAAVKAAVEPKALPPTPQPAELPPLKGPPKRTSPRGQWPAGGLQDRAQPAIQKGSPYLPHLVAERLDPKSKIAHELNNPGLAAEVLASLLLPLASHIHNHWAPPIAPFEADKQGALDSGSAAVPQGLLAAARTGPVQARSDREQTVANGKPVAALGTSEALSSTRANAHTTPADKPALADRPVPLPAAQVDPAVGQIADSAPGHFRGSVAPPNKSALPVGTVAAEPSALGGPQALPTANPPAITTAAQAPAVNGRVSTPQAPSTTPATATAPPTPRAVATLAVATLVSAPPQAAALPTAPTQAMSRAASRERPTPVEDPAEPVVYLGPPTALSEAPSPVKVDGLRRAYRAADAEPANAAPATPALDPVALTGALPMAVPMPASNPAPIGPAQAKLSAYSAQTPFEGHLPDSPGSSGFAAGLGAQLSLFAREGISHARLRLHPEEMGPLTVEIRLDGSQAQVHLSADHLHTRQALEQAVPSLAAALREGGLTLTGGGVSEQGRQPPQPGGSDGGRQPGRQAGTDDNASNSAATAQSPSAAASGLPTSPWAARRGVVDLVA